MSVSYVIDLETILNKNIHEVWLKDQKEDSGFPPPFCWEIVCMGYAKLVDKRLERLGVVCLPGAEKQGLKIFNQTVEDNEAQIITWNGRTFDLPVMSYRNMHHKNVMEWYHADRSSYKYRYNTDHHYDVKDYLSEYGQHKLSLDQAAKFLGLPGKMDTKGDDVQKLYENNDIASITTYCITDVIQTYLIYLRVEFLRGNLREDLYNELFEDTKIKLCAEGNLDLKDENHTVLGNNINKPETVAITKACRKLCRI